jgi:hypothetical protein
MRHSPQFLLCILFFSVCISVHGQKQGEKQNKDSVPAAKVDSIIKVDHSPRKAAIRSAIIPGWGQIYNKKYWKVPIVYAALGITGYVFVDNIKTYKEYRLAYRGKYNARVLHDSVDYYKMNPIYININEESIRAGRDKFRQYIDYSAVFIVVFWGLNVVDAIVDAHLKAFDISPDLSMKIKPVYNPLANSGGVSLVFNFRK